MLKSNIRPMIGSAVPAVTAEPFVEEELMDEQDEHVKDFWQKIFSQKQVPSFQVTGINRKTGELDNIQIFSPNTKHDGEYQLTYFDAKGEPISDRMVDQKMIDRIRQGDTLFITSLLPNSNQSLIYTVSYPDDDLKGKNPLIQADELWINMNSGKVMEENIGRTLRLQEATFIEDLQKEQVILKGKSYGKEIQTSLSSEEFALGTPFHFSQDTVKEIAKRKNEIFQVQQLKQLERS